MSHRRSRDENNAVDAGSRQQQRRPASIRELAEKAMDIDWDPSREFKHCLRMAERSRNQARGYYDAGDLENAFMYFARAAMIALDKLPTHPNYNTALNEVQRHNLGLNGQDILDNMSQIKPILVSRFNEWRAAHPDEPLVPLDELDRQQEQREQDQEMALADEAARRRQHREEIQRREDELRAQRQPARHHSYQSQHHPPPLDRRKEDAISVARQAAGAPVYSSPAPDYSFSRPTNQLHAHGSQSTIVVMPGSTDAGADSLARKREKEEKRRMEQEGIARRLQEADAEARQIRQAIAVNNSLPHGPQAQGQSLSTHSSASSVATNGSSPMFPHTQSSSAATTPASSFYHSQQPPPPPPPMPMPQPPVTHPPPAAATDVPPPPVTPVRAPPPSHMQSTPGNEPSPAGLLFPGSNPADLHRTPTRATLRGLSRYAPVTTTSPPPQDARLLFPSLMTPHQQRQGYYPSHNSMFLAMDRMTLNDTTNTPSFNNMYNPHTANVGWAFGGQESAKSAAAAAAAQVGQRIMDGMGKLKKSKYNSPAPLPPPPPPPGRHSPPKDGPGKALPYIPMPPPPLSALAAGGKIPISSGPHPSHSCQSGTTHSRTTLKERRLKTVVLPRETLPRFLAIAKLNTSMNRETCGLLLGREIWPGEESPPSYAHNTTMTKGRSSGKKMMMMMGNGSGEVRSEYVVTTLLIPKQHGSSDMCSMDGEELVLSFTEERSLITLGWIHTHPSQSCFMSSVDLHTHSGFQRMLPESIAVVCAPKSSPNFGIFRLTDPPGLQTILDCNEKEAFHPHPDLPIYTDADKGHVQMRDSPLEIIDLRDV